MSEGYKAEAVKSISDADQFALLVYDRLKKEVHSIMQTSSIGGSCMLMSFMSEFCDKYGEILFSDILVRFLATKETLNELFISSMKKG